MPEEEFKRYMSGEATPHDPTKQYSCEGLRLMHKNLESLAELRSRQEKLMAEALQLQKDMVDFKKSFRNEIEAVLARTPLTIKPRKVKVDLDADTVGAEHLPPPLLPQIIGDEAKGTSSHPVVLPAPASAQVSNSPVSDATNSTDSTAEAGPQHDEERPSESLSGTYQDTTSAVQKDTNSVVNHTVINNDSTNNNRVQSSTVPEPAVDSNKANGNLLSE